jgi:signal transduction histidine kinase
MGAEDKLEILNQTARCVSASLDLRETLETIVTAAAELVPCVLAEISLWDEERGVLVLQALFCEAKRRFPLGETYSPGEGYTGWVVRNRRPLLVPDVDARQDIQPDLLPGEYPFLAYLGLPLLTGDELIGTLVLIHDQAEAFNQDDLLLLETLAEQTAAAIRNAQLHDQVQCRARELAALNAIAAAINQALDLETLLADAVERVVQVAGADAGGIRLLDLQSGVLSFVVSQGLSPEYAARIQSVRLGEGIVGRVALTGEPVLIADMWKDDITGHQVGPGLQKEGLRARVEVPLRSQERVVGTLGVASRIPGAFGSADMDLMIAIGYQLGTAIENARLRQQALEGERLAAVGRVASTVAHDLRGPLGGIIRSAEFLARPELSDETRLKLSQAIVAMARRQINAAQEILDYTRGGQMVLRLTPCDLSGFLDELLEVLRLDCSDRGIELVGDWGYSGTVLMDPDRMGQVVYNIAANARDAMPEGGRLTITTCKVGEWVELRFTDTGAGVSPAVADRIFEPFVSYGKREGAGLGLSIAQRIVHEHRGEITFESPDCGGATFVVRLPLKEQGATPTDPPIESTPAA